jgi:hypothetical protein
MSKNFLFFGILLYFLPFFFTIYKLSINEDDKIKIIYRKQIIWYYICIFLPLLLCYYFIKNKK